MGLPLGGTEVHDMRSEAVGDSFRVFVGHCGPVRIGARSSLRVGWWRKPVAAEVGVGASSLVAGAVIAATYGDWSMALIAVVAALFGGRLAAAFSLRSRRRRDGSAVGRTVGDGSASRSVHGGEVSTSVDVMRSSSWGSSRLGWDVVLDGREVATVHDGRRVTLRTGPGEHALQVRNGRRHRSDVLRFEMTAGATLEVRCGEPLGRVQRVGPLGRCDPVLRWERASGGVRILSG